MDFKIGKSEFSMNIHELSTGLDKVSKLNGTFVFLYFFINLIIVLNYISVYTGLMGTEYSNDQSILLVPILGLITTFLVCSFHNYSTNLKNCSDLVGAVLALFTITLMFAIIPSIGFEFDVLGISADYWGFTSTTIIHILTYLISFMVMNVIVKAKAKSDKNHG